ncbi:MAG: two-component regulator propeller domain-containing protein [Bacteroidia bacterium]
MGKDFYLMPAFTKRTILIFIFILCSLEVYSQNNFLFQHLTSAQGLSQNTVNAVTQDKFGFIWIGTEAGLNRFDGKKIISFDFHESDSLSLPANEITSLFNDSKGTLWIGTTRGLCTFDFNRKLFHHILVPFGNLTNYISCLIEDHQNNLWIGTKGGLISYNLSDKKFNLFKSDTNSIQPYYANRITGITIDENNFIWVTTLKGVRCLDPVHRTFKTYVRDEKNPNSISNNYTQGIGADGNGKIYFGTIGNGLDLLYTKNDSIVHFNNLNKNHFITGNYLKDVFIDRAKNVWVATLDGGLNLLNSNNSFTNYCYNTTQLHGIADNELRCIFQDRSGLLWAGTAKSGVDRFTLKQKNFTTYFKESSWHDATDELSVNDLCKDKSGNIWLATNKGIVETNFEKQEFKIISNEFLNKQVAHEFFIYSVCFDSKNNIWVGAQPGAFKYNPVTKQTIAFPYLPTKKDPTEEIPFNPNDHSFIAGNAIFKILEMNNDSVLLLVSSGITIYSQSKKEFLHRYNNEALKNLPHGGYYTNGIIASDKSIWVEGSNHLLKLKPDFTIDSIYGHDKKNANSIPSNQVNDIIEDKKGNIWIATNSGIAEIEKVSGKVLRLNVADGLLSDYCKAMIEDDAGNLWISSLKGISCLKTNGVIKNYSINQNSFSNEFNNNSKLKISNHAFAFGGTKGFTVFNPNSIIENNFLPPVQLTSFKVNDKDFEISDSILNSELKLAYNQNTFSFEIAALSFDNADENQFTYKLEGFDKDWNYCKTRNFGSYTNLSPGNYVLHIKASNNDGVWNEEGLKLRIVIVPPFWKALWFKIIAVLLFAVTLFSIYKYRTSKIRNEEKAKSETERKIAEMRLTALRSQMNPHFIFNSLNSIQDFIANYERDDALKYLSKFSKLIRFILQQSGNNNTTVADELEMLNLYLELESLRFNNKFEYHFDIDAGLNLYATEIPSMIIQPFVENAILHGFIGRHDDCKIIISMKKSGNKLKCVIQDNGIGRKKGIEIKQNKSFQYAGVGIKLTTDRIETINKSSDKETVLSISDLVDTSGKAIGTKVELEFTIE